MPSLSPCGRHFVAPARAASTVACSLTSCCSAPLSAGYRTASGFAEEKDKRMEIKYIENHIHMNSGFEMTINHHTVHVEKRSMKLSLKYDCLCASVIERFHCTTNQMNDLFSTYLTLNGCLYIFILFFGLSCQLSMCMCVCVYIINY